MPQASTDACPPGPAGMACVPATTVSVAATRKPTEPRAEPGTLKAELPRFFIDAKPVTVADLERCAASRACPARSGAGAKADADGVLRGSSWLEARAVCSMLGKRLPTIWEWETAAAASAFVPEAEEWTATLARPGSDPALTGTTAANETPPTESRTSTPAANDEAASAATPSLDLLGPCSGIDPCPTAPAAITVVVDGGAWRRAVRPIGGATAGSPPRRLPGPVLKGVMVRCATTKPWLTAFPPLSLQQPRVARPETAPPTEEQRALAWSIDADRLEDKGVCSEEVRKSWKPEHQKGGHAMMSCRDPISYVLPNEKHMWGWRRYVENLGGGYVGVASDQNYNLAALARSEWVWLMDYDPNVVRLHRVVRVALLESPTALEFVARFAPAAKKEMLDAIAKEYAASPELPLLKQFYLSYASRLYAYYAGASQPNPKDAGWGWLVHDDQYQWIRRLTQQGRMVPIGGDMLGKKTMRNIGEAARKLGVPIRIYYTSNAPLSWGGMLSREYKDNVRALPMDEDSVVVATFNSGAFAQKDYWHYHVGSGLLQQERLALPGTQHVRQLVWDRIPTDDGDVTIVGLRSSP